MSDLLARIAVTAQQALTAHAKKHGVTVTPAMVDEVVISAKRLIFTGASIRNIYGHIQWRAEKIVQETAEHKTLISSMLSSMVGAQSAYLVTFQAG